MKAKITIIIDCPDKQGLNSIVHMVTFMADPGPVRDWEAEIKVEDVLEGDE